MNAINDVIDGNETLSGIKEWIITNPKRSAIIAAVIVIGIIIGIIIIVYLTKSGSSTAVNDPSPSPSISISPSILVSPTSSPSKAAGSSKVIIPSISPMANLTSPSQALNASASAAWNVTVSPSLNFTASPILNISASISFTPTPSTIPCTVPSYNLPCNGHGQLYPENNGFCECWDCYEGQFCEFKRLDSDCSLDVRGGMGGLGLMEEYWVGQHSTLSTQTAVDYRVTYQTDLVRLNPNSKNGLSKSLDQVIRAVHKKYGNIDPTGRQIILAAGTRSLFLAAFYAYSLAATNNSPLMTLFTRSPYIRDYATVCMMLKGYCQWNTSTQQDPTTSDLFEIIATPSDPEGKDYSTPFYANNSQYAYDLGAYWPHFAKTIPLTPRDAPIVFFGMSRLSGHGGSRVGWALVKNVTIANWMRQWIENTNIHLSVDGAYRLLQLMKYLNSTGGDDFFNITRTAIQTRWTDIQAAFATQTSGYGLEGEVGSSGYLWVSCPSFMSEDECYASFESNGLLGYRGRDYGVTTAPWKYRIGMTVRSYLWPTFINKLKQILGSP